MRKKKKLKRQVASSKFKQKSEVRYLLCNSRMSVSIKQKCFKLFLKCQE